MQPTLSYLVCATPRSGSTLLCEVLTTTGWAGHPKEYFEALKETGIPRTPGDYFRKSESAALLSLADTYARQGTVVPVLTSFANYEEYLAFVLETGTTPNGVFGAKLMWGYLEDFLLYLREIPAYRDLPVHQLFSTIFPDLHYIHVSRTDKIRQAISLWRAIQTWTWRQDQTSLKTSSPQAPKEVVFHYEAINYLVQRIVSHEESWALYFAEHDIQPFEVTYEELTSAYEETATRILQYLGVPLPEKCALVKPQMQRQSDALSEQWVEQYYHIQRQTT